MLTSAVCLPFSEIMSAKISRPFSSSQSSRYSKFSGNTLFSLDSRNGLYGQCIKIPTTDRRFELEKKSFRGRIYAKENGGTKGSEEEETRELYGEIDKIFVESAKRFQGSGYKPLTRFSENFQGNEGEAANWLLMEGCWVLEPTEMKSVAVVHFIGGAFVGVAPHLTYGLFLQTLAERGVTIIATPYPTGFQHFEIADKTKSDFEKCLRALNNGQVGHLPVFGVGHSLGALTQVLIASKSPKDADSKNATDRQGNVLLSYNNKEIVDSIPYFLPYMVVPLAFLAQTFVLIIKLIIKMFTAIQGAEFAWKILQDFVWKILQIIPFSKEILSFLEQLLPIIQALINGNIKMNPSPTETDKLAKASYGRKPNLLVKFSSDSIDESCHLKGILKHSIYLKDSDVELRTLNGGHARPIQQICQEAPRSPDGNPNPLVEAAENVKRWSAEFALRKLRESTKEDIESLVDEIAPFFGAHRRPISPGPIEVLTAWLGNLGKSK